MPRVGQALYSSTLSEVHLLRPGTRAHACMCRAMLPEMRTLPALEVCVAIWEFAEADTFATIAIRAESGGLRSAERAGAGRLGGVKRSSRLPREPAL